MITDKIQTQGADAIRATDLDRLMADLDRCKGDAWQLFLNRQQAQAAVTTHKRSVLLAAEDRLKGEEARLLMTVAMDKPTYPNEEARKAGVVKLKGPDTVYQNALRNYRSAEAELEDLQQKVQAAEDAIAAHKDLAWNLRTLTDGARSEITALAAFDGPRLPSEIAFIATDSILPDTIIHVAPASLLPSSVALTAPTEPIMAVLNQGDPIDVTLLQNEPIAATMVVIQEAPLVAHMMQSVPLQVTVSVPAPVPHLETLKEAG